MSERDRVVGELYRARPRSRVARATVVALIALTALAWIGGNFDMGDLTTPRSARNLTRFLGELRPYPLQGKAWDHAVFADWLKRTLGGKGAEAVLVTLAISIAAIVLAGFFAVLLSLPAARTVATPEPFLPAATPPRRIARLAWRGMIAATRALLVFLRAIPEYVWAFLLLGLLGPGAWPAVLALALHNTGILGKLGAEIVENTEPGPLRAMRGLGASRAQIGLMAILPAALGRSLLYFFYRWETCVREATVLGLLGVVSLGYWIQDARARMHYDVMFLYILLGVVLILVGDLVSAVARSLVRRSR